MAKSKLSHFVRQRILERIGQLLERGERLLPTERMLADETSASYSTVRLVMSRLESEGFVEKIQGSGTYLTSRAGSLLQQEMRRKVYFFCAPCQHEIRESFDGAMGYYMQRVASSRHVNLLIRPTDAHATVLDMLELEKPIHAPIIYLPHDSAPLPVSFLARLERLSQDPFVVLDLELTGIGLCNVTSDNRQGGMMAAAHLLRKGHRKVAILVTEPMLQQIRQRIQGFCEIYSLVNSQPQIIDCNRLGKQMNPVHNIGLVRDILSRPHDFTAIFSVSDAGAFLALVAMEQLHLRPGQDLSLIGFDGLELGKDHVPPLTTIVQPMEAMCQRALDLALHPTQEPQTVHVPLCLREGGTVSTLSDASISLARHASTLSCQFS